MMNREIVIQKEELEIVREIVASYLPIDAQVFVFGSRAKSTNKKWADLDLAVDAGRPLTPREVLDLEDQFEDCDLSYRVDIVDLATISENFKANIKGDLLPLGRA